MFRNTQRDPLAVPESVRRASVGPTRRTAAGYGEPLGYQHPNDDPSTQLGWQDSYDQMAEDELHRRHQERGGEGNPDPRDFYDPVRQNLDAQGLGGEVPPVQVGVGGPHRHEDLGFSSDDINRLKSQIPGPVARVIERQARDFMASDEADTPDSRELLYRAERHARTQTSDWSVEASQRATQAFCARVAELLPKARKQAAKTATHIADFDDYLLY